MSSSLPKGAVQMKKPTPSAGSPDNFEDGEKMEHEETSSSSYSYEGSCGSESCDSENCPAKCNASSLNNEGDEVGDENSEEIPTDESNKEIESDKEEDQNGDENSEDKPETGDKEKEKKVDEKKIMDKNHESTDDNRSGEAPLSSGDGKTLEKFDETDSITSRWEVIVSSKQPASAESSPQEEENPSVCNFYLKRYEPLVSDNDDINQKKSNDHNRSGKAPHPSDDDKALEKSDKTDSITSRWEVIVKSKQPASAESPPKEEESPSVCNLYLKRSEPLASDNDDINNRWEIKNIIEGKMTDSEKQDPKSTSKTEVKSATIFNIKRFCPSEPEDGKKKMKTTDNEASGQTVNDNVAVGVKKSPRRRSN